MMRAAICAALLAVAAASPAQYLITSLPGLTTPGPLNFKQYAGYMPLNDTSGTELFFWFVESQRNPSEDPVLLWMNGGPGASSVEYGFWTEHGPFLLAENGSLTLNPYSWNRQANIIYLEAPSGVGFSFSMDKAHYKTGDLQTARDNYRFLVNWFNIFDQFKSNPFMVTGESYGGHYVPTLALEILTNGLDANMTGFFIGNPGIQSDWFYNIDEYAFITQLWSNGYLPEDVYLNVYAQWGWSDFLTNCSKNFTNPTQACVTAAHAAWTYLPARWDPYDLLAPTCHSNSRMSREQQTNFYKRLTPKLFESGRVKEGSVYNPCIQNWPPTYMNREDVQKAIHAYPKRTNVPWPNAPGEYAPLRSSTCSTPLHNISVVLGEGWFDTLRQGE